MTASIVDDLEGAEQYRRELVGYCYRLLGAAGEAEDAAQEALIRAWRSRDRFEGRSSVRSWLYKIATNACIDMQRAPQRRALPMDVGGPSAIGADVDIGGVLDRTVWIEPIHDSRVLPDVRDPAESVMLRESVRLAFVAALQHLPPRQRAVLVLREVLEWTAAEVAELLDTSVDSVTSALARARSTMARIDSAARARPLEDSDHLLLDRYVAAFEAYDVAALVALLHEDAMFTMPPYAFWLRGREHIEQWWNGPGQVCRDSRIMRTRANGGPALAAYHLVAPGRWEPFALHLLELRDDRIGGICHFLDTAIFPDFGLPTALTV